MPTYSYRCTECGTAFDIAQAFTDDALTVCPTCGGRLRKIYGSVGVTFNGSGFYRNDSRASVGADKSSASTASPESTSSAPKPSTPGGSGSSGTGSGSGSSPRSTDN